MDKEITSLKTHKVSPVIKALEKQEEPVVELQGFIGSDQNGTMRLYRQLDTSSYIQIPKKAVVYIDEPDDESEEKVRVFVLDTYKLTEVTKYRAIASRLSFKDLRNINDFPPVERIKTFWTCARQCEGTFVDQVVQILITETRALQEQNPVRRDLLLAQVAQQKHQAKSALLFCLNVCGDEYGVPASWWVFNETTNRYEKDRFTIPKYHAYLIEKHLEKPE